VGSTRRITRSSAELLLAVALLGIAYFSEGGVSAGWLTGRARADGVGATDESTRLLGSGKENLHDTED
jgi:hypothetical protein